MFKVNVGEYTYKVGFYYPDKFKTSSRKNKRTVCKIFLVEGGVPELISIATAYRNGKDKVFIKHEGRKTSMKKALSKLGWEKKVRAEFWNVLLSRTNIYR